jgi:amino acid adenylation domain-containing protein
MPPSPANALTVDEHDALVVDYNATAAAYPAHQTVVDLFVAQAARTPNDEAIRFGDQALSYRALHERSNQIAAHLQGLGVGPNQLVVLRMEHSIEVVCALLGILKLGAAYVPVDSGIPRERLSWILRDIAEGSGSERPIVVSQSRLVDPPSSDIARVVAIDADFESVSSAPAHDIPSAATPDRLAYVIYTSGSTGRPKGVMIEHRSLLNYIWWANAQYARGSRLSWPLFSSLAFDLTVTSIFTPLISGGRIVVYNEDPGGHSMVIFKVVEDNAVDIVKLTPAHLAMIRSLELRSTRIRRLIVGGEDFKTELARGITEAFGGDVEIFNEYGPTEATVGCMIHRYDTATDRAASVPIGRPAANAQVFILDDELRPVAKGTVGQMYLAGDGLARGYFNRPDLTSQAFVEAADPRHRPSGTLAPSDAPRLRLYRTGDLARWTNDGQMEFLGRADFQVKLGGFRIELAEVEGSLLKHPDVLEAVVTVVNSTPETPAAPAIVHCERCGLASNFPGATYDTEGVCNICRAYEKYAVKAEAYFRSPSDLKAIAEKMKATRSGAYDCLVLLSGGKDSTYMLYQLCGLGLKPLVYTLDNGYISDEAKINIRRTVEALGVDLVFGTTPHMNEIFVDSLRRFSNVCNGCFKTVYTLATNLARERGIHYIVTGLSRGQFFETRLTAEVFDRDDFDVDRIDTLVLDARKAYHHRDDAVSCYLDVDAFRDDSVFDDVQFVDFYRYWSVPLEEMYAFLDTHASWVRPSDTGRSTNCLINDLGIYLHKKQRGFHNYSLPYSWDVRLGQKTREEAIEELDDEIDEANVRRMMAEIGYVEPEPSDSRGVDRLVAYYVSDRALSPADLRAHLALDLPEYMLPSVFVRLEKMPLTTNGKVDRQALPTPSIESLAPLEDFVGPSTETEKQLTEIWSGLLNVQRIGINDEFFELGGHSLLAIRALSRIRDVFKVDIPLTVMFASSTIAKLGAAVDSAREASRRSNTEPKRSGSPIARQARRATNKTS